MASGKPIRKYFMALVIVLAGIAMLTVSVQHNAKSIRKAAVKNPAANVAKAFRRPRLNEKAVDPTLRSAQNDRNKQLTDHNYETRLNAIHEMTKGKDPQSVALLLGALNDKKAVVRMAAAEALGDFNDVRAIEPLIAAMADKDVIVRSAACTALGKMAGIRSIAPLIAALKHPSPLVRNGAIAALGKGREVRAVEPILPALRDPDASVRSMALKTLGDMNAISGFEPFAAALKDSSPIVRLTAVEQLGKLKQPRERLAGRAGVFAVDLLLPALKDSDRSVRSAAGEALAGMEDPRALGALMEAVKERNLDILERAYRFFLDRPDVDSAGVLIELLRRRGSPEMAEDFLNSYNEALRKAAEEWAKKNHHRIVMRMK